MPLYKSRLAPLFTDPAIPNNLDCGEPEYCHQFIPGDHLRSQFYQTPCGQNEMCDITFEDVTLGAELLANGTFTGSDAGWSKTGNWAWDATNVEECTAGAVSQLYQSGISLSDGNFYRVTFDLTRSAGSLRAVVGDGAGASASPYLSATGSYSIDLYFGDPADDIFQFETDDEFVGFVDNVSVKKVDYTCWTPNPFWSLSEDGACKTAVGVGDLEESVADYITADGYYQLSFTISNYTSGTLTAWVADVTDQDATEIDTNGNFTLYFEPTATGVVKFTPSSDFIGCISFPATVEGNDDWIAGLAELKNDYIIEIVEPSAETALYQVEASYYHQWVTFDYDIEGETLAADGIGLPYGCYNIYVYDTCLVTGQELVTNGTFNTNTDDWTIGSYGNSIAVVAGQFEATFNPLTGSQLVTNGDTFVGWTAGAGWALSGGGMQHTPGSTATLATTITIVATPVPSIQYYFKFEITGRTAGNVSITIGNATSITTYSINDTIVGFVQPTGAGGVVTLSFNPSTTFDGTIDNVEVYQHNGLMPTVIMNNVFNPNMVAANYKVDVELVSVPNPAVDGIRGGINGWSLPNYDATIGLQSNTFNNYIPGTQQAQVWIKFTDSTTNNMYPGTIVIDNVSMYRIEPFDATYVSECFQYRETMPNSKLFQGYCDSASLGFEFVNSGFRLQERLACRSFAPSYEKDKRIFNYGSGRSGVYYSELTKWFAVYLDAVPETVHDTIAVILDTDHFGIGEMEDNVIEYVAKPDDYTPEWDRSGLHSLATSRFEVKPKVDGQLFNRDC